MHENRETSELSSRGNGVDQPEKAESRTTGANGTEGSETCLVVMWCPGYKWRDSSLGSSPELENLFCGAKGKGTSGSPARPKVLIRKAGADCPVVATQRGNAREAVGRSPTSWPVLVNWQQDEPRGHDGRRQPSGVARAE
jgi:hypothetical protein